MVKASKGKGTTIKTDQGEYDPDTTTTISRGVGKCPNCTSVIEDDVIKSQAKSSGLGHQLYAVAYKEDKGGLQFRIPTDFDLDGVAKAEAYLQEKLASFEINNIVPDVDVTHGQETERLFSIGIDKWYKFFNPRQLLTLVTYLMLRTC